MKKVLSIGQCNADHSRISQTLENHFDVEIVTADTEAEAIQKISEGSFALVLINRILDQTHSEGIEIIRKVRTSETPSTTPIMLVSNFEDAQKTAMESGAVAGFGKAAMSDPSTIALLEPFLAE